MVELAILKLVRSRFEADRADPLLFCVLRGLHGSCLIVMLSEWSNISDLQYSASGRIQHHDPISLSFDRLTGHKG